MSAAKPMDRASRVAMYLEQNGGWFLTPRQLRRVDKKANRALRVEAGRELTPRQSRWAGIRATRAARRAGAEL